MTVNLPVCEDVCLAAFYLEIAIKEKKKIENGFFRRVRRNLKNKRTLQSLDFQGFFLILFYLNWIAVGCRIIYYIITYLQKCAPYQSALPKKFFEM